MSHNSPSDFSDLFASNAQSLGNTGEKEQVGLVPPTGGALGERLHSNPSTGSSRDAGVSSMLPAAAPAGEIVPIETMPSPLWNRKKPSYERQQELPWHRTVYEMAVNGYTAEEIAARLGCSPPTVQDILKQPHSQQTQVNMIRQAANQDHEVCEMIKENVKAAVKTLANIVSDDKARGSDRIAAARELLDRRYGKPNQPMNRGTDVDLNNLSDADLAKMLPATTETLTNK